MNPCFDLFEPLLADVRTAALRGLHWELQVRAERSWAGDSGVSCDVVVLTWNNLPLLTDYLNRNENSLIPEQIKVSANSLSSLLESNPNMRDTIL